MSVSPFVADSSAATAIVHKERPMLYQKAFLPPAEVVPEKIVNV